jgi:RNA polymerase sigma-70 factor (ECF subfamily)
MDKKTLNLKKIYNDYRPGILRYLSGMVGAHEAEDLTQEVFAKIGRSLRGFRGESRLSTWIYRIATNAALDRLRSASFKAARSSRHSGDEVEEWTGKKPPAPEGLLMRKEMNQCILKLLEKLPENYRAVVVLKEMEGFTSREISEILGLSLDTVKMRLHRGRARLKKEFQAHCDLYRDNRNELACDLKHEFREFRKSYWPVSFPKGVSRGHEPPGSGR